MYPMPLDSSFDSCSPVWQWVEMRFYVSNSIKNTVYANIGIYKYNQPNFIELFVNVRHTLQ